MIPDKIYFDGTSSACSLPVFSSQNIEYIRKDAVLEWANVHKQVICINGNEESAYDRGQYSVILALIDKLNSL